MVKRSFRYYYLRVVRQSGSPEQIAGGMALGIFIAFTVPPPLQIVSAVALAFLFGLNKITAALGCLVTNPITWPPIIVFQTMLGTALLRTPSPAVTPDHVDSFWASMKHLVTNASLDQLKAFLLGAAITGILAAGLGFVLTRWVVIVFRRRKRLREERRRLGHAPSQP